MKGQRIFVTHSLKKREQHNQRIIKMSVVNIPRDIPNEREKMHDKKLCT